VNYKSVFDIIGPIMIGPSSSHTAGAARIGAAARQIFGKTPKNIIAYFYGSFAETYQGHGTDIAIIGGLLGFDTDNPNIPNSIDIAKKENINIEFLVSDDTPPHPNTAKLIISDEENTLNIVGISIGGGSIQILEINDIKIESEKESFIIIHSKELTKLENISEVLKKLNTQDLTKKGASKFFLTIAYYNSDENVENIMQQIQASSDVLEIIQIN